MKKLILVNRQNKIVGYEEKVKAHLGNGVLHRAFSIYIFNNKGELLIQKRSKHKMLWPLYWSNTCCSHPLKGENYKKLLKNRLKEEMGFPCPLKVVDKFYYRAKYKKIGSENELCDIVIGKYSGKVKPNKKEVADFRWIDLNTISKDVKKNPNKYTPWFKICLPKIKKWTKS